MTLKNLGPRPLIEAHLKFVEAVVRKQEPVKFGILLREVLRCAKEKGLSTSKTYIAHLVLAATLNLEPARIVYPEVKPFLLIAPDGRFGLAPGGSHGAA